MAENGWTKANMPDLNGKVAIVTGANSGLGYEVTKGLAEKGAHVVLACRNLQKATPALEQLRRETAAASLDVMALDLADLASIQRFAAAFTQRYDRLDILCNNAGLMAIPRRETKDGFEMQFGTNHLGHFALTGHLIDLVMRTPGARVVNVSSGLHQQGKMNFDDLMGKQQYREGDAYSQSKLANLLFAYELERKLRATAVTAISVGTHPGYAATNLQGVGPAMSGSRAKAWLMKAANAIFAQSAEMGALPLLMAATDPTVNGCDYIGPTGTLGMRGYPAKVRSSPASYDEGAAQRLWAVSETLTGVRYTALTQPQQAVLA